jgi:hypothetical protein
MSLGLGFFHKTIASVHTTARTQKIRERLQIALFRREAKRTRSIQLDVQ